MGQGSGFAAWLCLGEGFCKLLRLPGSAEHASQPAQGPGKVYKSIHIPKLARLLSGREDIHLVPMWCQAWGGARPGWPELGVPGWEGVRAQLEPTHPPVHPLTWPGCCQQPTVFQCTGAWGCEAGAEHPRCVGLKGTVCGAVSGWCQHIPAVTAHTLAAQGHRHRASPVKELPSPAHKPSWVKHPSHGPSEHPVPWPSTSG